MKLETFLKGKKKGLASFTISVPAIDQTNTFFIVMESVFDQAIKEAWELGNHGSTVKLKKKDYRDFLLTMEKERK